MPNRRDIKKDINSVLGGVLEECYSEMLNNPEKNDVKINAIIDEAVDLADDLIARVNGAKKLKSGKEVKASFNSIMEELQDKAIVYVERLNDLS